MKGQIMCRGSLLTRIRKLDAEEQIQLLGELTLMVNAKQTGKKHSVTELKGLGKEIWEGIAAQKYVDNERESWTG
jgi:hypothetical protein